MASCCTPPPRWDSRLKAIPVRRSQRRPVLERLARRFEPDRAYRILALAAASWDLLDR